MFPYLKVGCRVLSRDLCVTFLRGFFGLACEYQIYTLVVFEYKVICSFLKETVKDTKLYVENKSVLLFTDSKFYSNRVS